MGMYLNPIRVDLKFVDSLRKGKAKAWKILAPEVKGLSSKEKEAFEHFAF